MPALTGRPSAWGPMVDVKIMQSLQLAEALRKRGKPAAVPTTCLALLDTGASSSALDYRLVASLGLMFHGSVTVHTPSTGPNVVVRNTYDACFVFDESGPDPLVATVAVIETDFTGQGMLALIGRDILDLCTFVYDGRGGTFRLEW